MKKNLILNTILVGAQWGDEGKGKVIDLLTEDSDVIVRYQGGNNAGHTVKFEDQTFVLHLVPSGVLRRGKVCVIANGVVIDPEAFFKELDMLKDRKVSVRNRLWVSDAAHVIMPYHKVLDCLKEEQAEGDAKIGTTKRGIGPCYADKVARLGIRVADLIDPKVFRDRLNAVLPEKNSILQKVYGGKPLALEKLYRTYLAYGRRLKPFVADTKLLLYEAMRKKKRILFEGAQGTILDIDHGSYPYVTSSNATAGGAITGSGVGPHQIHRVIGVMKAYTTRVGEGPFPTQFDDRLMEQIRQKGEEFGATTGRPRRCGWFDAVVGRHAVMTNGADELAVMKLDVLDDLKSIKVCTAYRVNGKLVKHYPSNIGHLSAARPVYKELPGWREDTTSVTRFEDLPQNAKRYLRYLSGILEVPIRLVSVGSKRSQTIFL